MASAAELPFLDLFHSDLVSACLHNKYLGMTVIA